MSDDMGDWVDSPSFLLFGALVVGLLWLFVASVAWLFWLIL